MMQPVSLLSSLTAWLVCAVLSMPREVITRRWESHEALMNTKQLREEEEQSRKFSFSKCYSGYENAARIEKTVAILRNVLFV